MSEENSVAGFVEGLRKQLIAKSGGKVSFFDTLLVAARSTGAAKKLSARDFVAMSKAVGRLHESELAAPREAVDALIEAGSFLSESVSRLAGDIDCRCGPDGVCDDHERIRAWWIALARCKAATEGEG